MLFSEDSCYHPAPAAPALHLLPVSIIASLPPAASVALILFLIKFKFICELQDNGMSVCLHSGFILGRCSPTFPAGQTDRRSSCLTQREQLSANTENAGSQVTQGWLTLAVSAQFYPPTMAGWPLPCPDLCRVPGCAHCSGL